MHVHFFKIYTVCVCIYIYIINTEHAYIMQTKPFILNAI